MKSKGSHKILKAFLKIQRRVPVYAMCISFLCLSGMQKTSAQERFTVVLDAGHGGHDPGKVAKNSFKEKDIALKIVLKIGAILEKNKNIKVIYTRKTDVFVDLWKRGSIANKANADLFISIHCNAHTSQAFGAETWVLGTRGNSKNFEITKSENSVILLEENYEENYKGFDPNSPETEIALTLNQEKSLDNSITFAGMVQKDFTNKLKRKNRGVKQSAFVVLHQTYMPSVLIETGFITNSSEGKFLNSSNGQSKMATTIANSILTYKSNIDKNKSAIDASNPTPKHIPSKTSKIFKGITFKVQIAAGKNKIATKSYNFKGLSNVERLKIKEIYRYFYGNTSDYEVIKAALKKAKNVGYNTAFIVAYKKGVRVNINKVLKNEL